MTAWTRDGRYRTKLFDQTFSNFEIIAEENDKLFRGDNQVDKVICSDKTLLKQLMTILYDNALKYTDEDGEIQFEVQLKDKNLLWEYWIMVQGFEMRIRNGSLIVFTGSRQRPEPVKKVDLVLGLSLAKQIVEAFKGTIQVKDNKPKGPSLKWNYPLRRKVVKKIVHNLLKIEKRKTYEFKNVAHLPSCGKLRKVNRFLPRCFWFWRKTSERFSRLQVHDCLFGLAWRWLWAGIDLH